MKKILGTIVLLCSVVCAFTASAQSRSMHINLNNGTVMTINVDDIEQFGFEKVEDNPVENSVAVGDYYYSDGTWSSGKEAPLADKTCIGIVFYVGRCREALDNCNYKLKDGKTSLSDVKAYVVALDNASESAAWGSWDVDGDDGAGTSHDKTDFMGYYNTTTIKAKAVSKCGALSADASNNYPATYYAVEYEKTCPAPESSTGWFLPSAYQLQYMHRHADEFNEQFANIAGAKKVYDRDAIYWSSTEAYKQNGARYWSYMVNLDTANSTPGYISDQQKTKSYKVRSILVF